MPKVVTMTAVLEFEVPDGDALADAKNPYWSTSARADEVLTALHGAQVKLVEIEYCSIEDKE